MKYLLDTDTLIDIIGNHDDSKRRIESLIAGQNVVALCPITVTELYAGLIEQRRSQWDPFIEALPYWEISSKVARQAGIDRYDLKKMGRTISLTDSLIAAVAREHGATVLTRNTKDYPQSDVQVRSLRETMAA